MQARSRGVTAGQLIAELGVSKPTIYRDLEILRDSPLPIAATPVNGEVRYRLSPDAFSLPSPSSIQALALAVVRRFLGYLEGTAVEEAIDGFLQLAPSWTPFLSPPLRSSPPTTPGTCGRLSGARS
jgi:hypothetical protein